jgi:hypothetical protein
MPNSSDKLNPHAVVLDTIPGESTRVVWDPVNQSVEYAQILCKRIRAGGAIVVGCSLDELVKKGRTCPVCGAKGIA